MKKLIVLMMVLTIGTANARILEIEYKRMADNVYEGRTQYGRSLIMTDACFGDLSLIGTWYKGYVNEKKIGDGYYYTLATKYLTCSIVDMEELETYENNN